jgi:hypothetical protein
VDAQVSDRRSLRTSPFHHNHSSSEAGYGNITPYQMKRGFGGSKPVSDWPSHVAWNGTAATVGVLMGVVRDPREDGSWVASTAFRWGHASWDNAGSGLPGGSRAGEQCRYRCRPLLTHSGE